MKVKLIAKALVAGVAGLFFIAAGGARADTVDARCDIYPKGSDKASAMLACTFSQRQGYVAIDRSDGVRHELSPKGGAGSYIDQDGKPAYRTRGLGKSGQIYRLARESVFVYWDTAGLPGKAGAAAPVPATPTVPVSYTHLTLPTNREV